MKITFLGAAKIVTGSNFLVEAAGKKFLVDCGMYQGKATHEKENEEPFLFNVQDIDFMLLTHAHIDHSGRIPKLYNEGYRNPVYATKATCDLCTIMLPDSGHIQEMEIEWKNRKRKRAGQKELPPLYTAEQATKSLEIFKGVKYDEIIEVDENIKVRFNDAGHMLGSSIIEIWATENGKVEKAVFTGDLGNNDIPLLASPTMIESADYLVMESTYGSRLHMRNDDKAELFLNIVSETLDKGGTVVIPSFAVGRTQEIVYEINKLKDNLYLEITYNDKEKETIKLRYRRDYQNSSLFFLKQRKESQKIGKISKEPVIAKAEIKEEKKEEETKPTIQEEQPKQETQPESPKPQEEKAPELPQPEPTITNEQIVNKIKETCDLDSGIYMCGYDNYHYAIMYYDGMDKIEFYEDFNLMGTIYPTEERQVCSINDCEAKIDNIVKNYLFA